MIAMTTPEARAEDLKKTYHGCLWAEPSQIVDNPYNPRDLLIPGEVSRLKDLARSIAEYGLWQYPLVTRIQGIDELVILAGHRRVCAMKDFLRWPVIPYHPSEWHGLPESFDMRDAMYVLVMDQELNKTHSGAQKAKIAHEMHTKNIAPIGMPKSWESRRRVWEFVDMYPELKDRILLKATSGKHASKSLDVVDGKRTSLGWTIVNAALQRCRGHHDIAIKHIRKYITLEHPDIYTMRDAIKEEVSQRLKELA